MSETRTGIFLTLEKDVYFLPIEERMELIAKHEYLQALEKGLDKFKNSVKIPKGTKAECLDILIDKHDANKEINVLFLLDFEKYEIIDYVSPDDVMEKI